MAADAALILAPLYSDVGVRLTPALSGGSWAATLPLSNLQKRELATVARSTDATLGSTRFRADLQEDKQVRCIALVYRSPERVGAPSTVARFRYLGVASSAQSLLFDYEAGNDVTAAGGTFTRASVATYFGLDGLLKSAASGVIRDAHFIGAVRNTLLEDARTNVVLRKRDLSNAAWTKTNATAARDQVGIDGGSNTASSLLATAGNATALQAITLASSQRLQSAYVKRLVGSGNIQMTTDNGATWTTVTVTGAWTRVTIPAQTLANPTVGFRIVTNGDKVAIDWVQNETGAFASSPIGTLTDNTATETRVADVLYFAFTFPPLAMTVYAAGTDLGTLTAGRFWQISNAGNTGAQVLTQGTSGNVSAAMLDGLGGSTATTGVAAASGSSIEARTVLAANGALTVGVSVNGGAETTTAASTPLALPGAWSDTRLYLNSAGSSAGMGFFAFRSLRIMAGVQTLATMQALVFDSGWLTPFPAGKTTDDTEGVNLGAYCILAAARTLRYIDVQIDDSLNAAGHIDLCRLAVTGNVPATHNMSVGASRGLETGTTAEDSDGSVTTYIRRATRRSVTCIFEEQADADAEAMFDWQRVTGIDRQFVWCFDPTDTTNLWRWTYLATLKQLSKFEANIGNRWGIPYEIREVL